MLLPLSGSISSGENPAPLNSFQLSTSASHLVQDNSVIFSCSATVLSTHPSLSSATVMTSSLLPLYLYCVHGAFPLAKSIQSCACLVDISFSFCVGYRNCSVLFFMV
jgi:hypothetical protein